MRALSKRMNTRVRTSRAVNLHVLSGHALKCPLKMILNRVAVRLTLPSGEGAAIISERKLQACCHLIRRLFLRLLSLHLKLIKITLQNHLRRNLINLAARLSRRAAGFAQRTICRHGR
jgi:hypothetical protein